MSSSSKQQKKQGDKEALQKMRKITTSLLSRTDAAPFREPVDWRGLGLSDYPQIITKMMDLGTVKRKMDRGQYDNAAQCAADIRLIWDNCKTYNMEGSDFYILADGLSRRFEERYKKICDQHDVGEDTSAASGASSTTPKSAKSSSRAATNQVNSVPTGPLSLDAKIGLATKIFRLSGQELGHAINILELRCPQALEKCGTDSRPGAPGNVSVLDEDSEDDGIRTDEMEINVDSIDNRTFLELSTYVTEALSNGGRNAVVDDGIGAPSSRGARSSRASSASVAEDEGDYEEVEVEVDSEEVEFDDEEEEEEEDEEEEEMEVIKKRTTKRRRRSND
mmetsp:Transcript_6869/g.14996  ORF Transcript_6869/g.14996 Transcript_6869/m.14996 type:complete len:335 (-) Transcript_6869:1463-2467(-)